MGFCVLLMKQAGNVNEAQVLFEYGKNHEGYWTSHHFMHQIENALKVAEAKYRKEGYCICWIFFITAAVTIPM